MTNDTKHVFACYGTRDYRSISITARTYLGRREYIVSNSDDVLHTDFSVVLTREQLIALRDAITRELKATQ